ncbi:MAG: hypothetical protein P4L10_11195 [Acidobacteriaceae bacterium]|nr:hypothetical protein [Acidobacteriaceae bacterium]
MLRKISIAACSALALSACSTSGQAVPYAVVQSESATITKAIDTIAPGLIKTLPPATQLNANAAVAALNAANTALQATTSGTSAITVTENVVNVVSAVTAVLPLPANTQLAISAGVVLIDAFLGALPQPTPAKVGAEYGAVPYIPGPIPIPLQ